jgi:hypothetical protein
MIGKPFDFDCPPVIGWILAAVVVSVIVLTIARKKERGPSNQVVTVLVSGKSRSGRTVLLFASSEDMRELGWEPDPETRTWIGKLGTRFVSRPIVPQEVAEAGERWREPEKSEEARRVEAWPPKTTGDPYYVYRYLRAGALDDGVILDVVDVAETTWETIHGELGRMVQSPGAESRLVERTLSAEALIAVVDVAKLREDVRDESATLADGTLQETLQETLSLVQLAAANQSKPPAVAVVFSQCDVKGTIEVARLVAALNEGRDDDGISWAGPLDAARTQLIWFRERVEAVGGRVRLFQASPVASWVERGAITERRAKALSPNFSRTSEGLDLAAPLAWCVRMVMRR